MKELVFSLKLDSVPVKITDKDGAEKIYTLRGLTSDERSRFLNQTTKKVSMGTAVGREKITDHHFLQENLLTLCLLDDEDKLVTREVLAKYPAKVISSLFEAAQELSGMNDDGEEEAKND